MHIEKKVAKLQTKQREILRKIKKLKEKNMLREQRKKILVGTYFIEQYKKQNNLDELKKIMASYVTKKEDKELFD